MIIMTNYAKNIDRTAIQTPQNKPVIDKDQIKNKAGGYVFQVDLWTRLDRFIILGSDNNTFYVDQVTLTNENYEAIIECVKKDGNHTVNRIVELSDSGRAVKNSPAVFALAVCAVFGDKETKELAFRNMPKVARTATDFFDFVNDYKTLGGSFGTVAKKGIAAWYQNKEISQAAYQIIKYRQRNGWTHLDALRLSHPKPKNKLENNLYSFAKFLAKKEGEFSEKDLPEIAQGYLKAQRSNSVSEIVNLITDHNLPREAIPTEFLNKVEVWDALLQKMPATALVRNLGKMTSIGVIQYNNENSQLVCKKFDDSDWLKKNRLHPLTILNALAVYRKGHGDKGSLSWTPNKHVMNALDNAFYNAFDNVEPTNKKIMIALDASGSMAGYKPNNFSLSAREISAAMSMITAYTENDYLITYFSRHGNNGVHMGNLRDSGISEIDINPRQRLDGVIDSISNLPWGGTDCALPITWAFKNDIDIDTFIIYTDNDTWAGNIHPFEALNQYRRKKNADAKLIVSSVVPASYSIADPNDAGMLDIVGFDSNIPTLISDFIKGEV